MTTGQHLGLAEHALLAAQRGGDPSRRRLGALGDERGPDSVDQRRGRPTSGRDQRSCRPPTGEVVEQAAAEPRERAAGPPARRLAALERRSQALLGTQESGQRKAERLGDRLAGESGRRRATHDHADVVGHRAHRRRTRVRPRQVARTSAGTITSASAGAAERLPRRRRRAPAAGRRRRGRDRGGRPAAPPPSRPGRPRRVGPRSHDSTASSPIVGRPSASIAGAHPTAGRARAAASAWPDGVLAAEQQVDPATERVAVDQHGPPARRRRRPSPAPRRASTPRRRRGRRSCTRPARPAHRRSAQSASRPTSHASSSGSCTTRSRPELDRRPSTPSWSSGSSADQHDVLPARQPGRRRARRPRRCRSPPAARCPSCARAAAGSPTTSTSADAAAASRSTSSSSRSSRGDDERAPVRRVGTGCGRRPAGRRSSTQPGGTQPEAARRRCLAARSRPLPLALSPGHPATPSRRRPRLATGPSARAWSRSAATRQAGGNLGMAGTHGAVAACGQRPRTATTPAGGLAGAVMWPGPGGWYRPRLRAANRSGKPVPERLVTQSIQPGDFPSSR